MKLRDIVALLALVVMVKGAWMAALAQPVILGIGAALAAFDSEVLDVQLFEAGTDKSWLPLVNMQDKSEPAAKNEAGWAVIPDGKPLSELSGPVAAIAAKATPEPADKVIDTRRKTSEECVAEIVKE